MTRESGPFASRKPRCARGGVSMRVKHPPRFFGTPARYFIPRRTNRDPSIVRVSVRWVLRWTIFERSHRLSRISDLRDEQILVLYAFFTHVLISFQKRDASSLTRRRQLAQISDVPLPTSSFRQFAASRIPRAPFLPSVPNFSHRPRQYHRNRVAPILRSWFARGIQFARSIRKPSKRKFSRCAAKLALKRQRCSKGRNNVVGRSYLSLSALSPFLPSLNLLFFVFQTYDAAGKRWTNIVNLRCCLGEGGTDWNPWIQLALSRETRGKRCRAFRISDTSRALEYPIEL